MRNVFYAVIMLMVYCFISTISLAQKKGYGYNDKDRIVQDTLSERDYNSLIGFLQKQTTEIIKDTIIIKYDFENDNCWKLLNERSKKYIHSVIASAQAYRDKYSASHPNVSVFKYREPGNKFSKLKKWDETIVIDSSKFLYNLLFQKYFSTCGTSISIMPDRRLVIIRSDSHFEALK